MSPTGSLDPWLSFKRLDPEHDRDCGPDNVNNVQQGNDNVNSVCQNNDNVNPMYIKSRIRNNHQEAVLSILIDTGAKSNLISVSALSKLGKFPKLKTESIRLSGANGSTLKTLGSITLFVKLGDSEHLLKFHVVNNLATTAILGSADLAALHAQIDCTSGTITFGNDRLIPLQQPSDSPVITNTKISLGPGEKRLISCRTKRRDGFRGSHIVTACETHSRQLVNCIVDINGRNQFDVCIYNPGNTPLHIRKNTVIGTLAPVTGDCELYLIDESDIDVIHNEMHGDTVFPVISSKNKRSRVKKPTFSRPLRDVCELSDEEIIRSQIRFNGKLLTDGEKRYLLKLVLKYRDAFSLRGELGRSNSLIYDIRLKHDAESFYRQPYKSSDHERVLMRQEIAKLIKLGIVEESGKHYIPFCSPALLVAKSDNSARLISDFRLLNSSCKVDHYVFQRIEDILTKIGKMQPSYFATFDMCDSFFQIPLSDDSKPLTTFTTEPHKLYQYVRLPQGLHNSPAALAKLTDRVFGHLDFLIAYADDMAITAKTKDEYFKNLETFLQCVIKDNLKLSLQKSVLLDDHCNFLGHLIKDGKITPTQKHLDAIAKMERPKDKATLKRILGSFNWLKKYIKCYSEKAHDLYQLLKKNVAFIWTDKHEKAFQSIKEYLLSNHVIKLPTGTGQYLLYTDGSQTGLGATLLESVNGEIHVVGYASRSTTAAEKKSSVTELELAAISYALKSFRHLLYNPAPFKIFTDHYAIVHILAGKSPVATKKIANLVSSISEYNFELFHVSGSENSLADLLSRMPDHENQSNSIPEFVNVADDVTPPLRRSPRLAAKAALQQPSHIPAPPTSLRRSPRLAAKNSASQNEIKISSQPSPSMLRTPSGSSVQSDKDISVPLEPPTSSFEPTIDAPLSVPPLLHLLNSKVTSDSQQRRLSDMSTPVDSFENKSLDGQQRTYFPETKPLFDDDSVSIKFSNKFHGSVPERTRQKVRALALKDFNIDISKDSLRTGQRNDPFYRDLIAFLEHRILPTNKQHAKRILNQEEHYCLIGDVLFRLPRHQDIHDVTRLRLQLVIPESLADAVISAKHDKFLGTGHAGFLRCLLSIKRKYYVHDLANKLRDYIGKCGLCLKLRNAKKSDYKAPLRPAAAKSCDGPFQRLQIDHCGPFPSRQYSSKHILVITDEFSHFTWLYAVDSTGAEEAFNCLNRLIRIYGIPFRGISSDRGSAFTSQIMSAVSSVYGVKWAHDLSANPSSTGLVENRVKMTKQLIKYVILTNKDVDVFDCLLDVMFSLNNCSSSVTGLTPHFVFHGFETIDPTDNNLQLANSLPSAPVQFAEVLQQENKRRNELIKICKEAAAREMKYNFDRSIVALPDFQPGDLVLVESHNHPRNSTSMRKFKVQRRGPYYVHAIDGYHCVLRDVDGHILNDLFPIRKLQKIDGYKESFPADRETVNVSQLFDSSSLENDDSELDSDDGEDNALDVDDCASNERESSVDCETVNVSQLFDSSNLESNVSQTIGHEPEVRVDVNAPAAVLSEPGHAFDTDNERPGLDDITVKVVLGNKRRYRHGSIEVLCYPMGVKQCGTYIPVQYLCPWIL